MKRSNKLLIIIAGPTASGKTALSINLALHYKTEIVSADSRQFFKELTIGTAKPTTEELNKVPHYFINSHSIADDFNAGAFAIAARSLLDDLFKKHNIVILSGGSGLYIDALINGIDEFPAVDKTIRAKLKEIENTTGIAALQKMLFENDPDAFKLIDINNPRRIIRALEVTFSSGKPYSTFLGNNNFSFPYNYLLIGINHERKKLYDRINERTIAMIEAGLEKEALGVIAFRDKNALKTVGYKELFEYFDGKISLAEAQELIAKNSRNYAKRQLTWFRRYKEMIWITPGGEQQVIEIVDRTVNENI